jgi:hypothetical protein
VAITPTPRTRLLDRPGERHAVDLGDERLRLGLWQEGGAGGVAGQIPQTGRAEAKGLRDRQVLLAEAGPEHRRSSEFSVTTRPSSMRRGSGCAASDAPSSLVISANSSALLRCRQMSR